MTERLQGQRGNRGRIVGGGLLVGLLVGSGLGLSACGAVAHSGDDVLRAGGKMLSGAKTYGNELARNGAGAGRTIKLGGVIAQRIDASSFAVQTTGTLDDGVALSRIAVSADPNSQAVYTKYVTHKTLPNETTEITEEDIEAVQCVVDVTGVTLDTHKSIQAKGVTVWQQLNGEWIEQTTFNGMENFLENGGKIDYCDLVQSAIKNAG